MKLLQKFALIILFFTALALQGADGIQSYAFFGRNYVKIQHIAKRYHLLAGKSSGRFILRGKYHRFSFTPEKQIAAFNGVQMVLSFPAFEKAGSYYISETDYETIVLPLLSRSSLKKDYIRKIFIDPGHGGKDVGAEGRYHQEKKLTLRLAAKLRRLLQKKGFNVVMSRAGDNTVSLEQRADRANAVKSDLFISLHFNAAADRSVYGLETYCVTPAGAASSNSSKKESATFPGNRFDANSFILAYLTQRNMLAKSKALDRGVKHARFYVLKNLKCPAILVEAGFLSNPVSEKLIASDEYLNQIAEGITGAIVNYKLAVKP